MAHIEFDGFVDKHTGNGPWTITESHRAKDDQDQWITRARTFHRVWLPQGVFLNEGDLVTVVGTQKTVTYETNGEKKYNLVVNAETVAVKRPTRAAVANSAPAQDSWPAPGGYNDDDSIPF